MLSISIMICRNINILTKKKKPQTNHLLPFFFFKCLTHTSSVYQQNQISCLFAFYGNIEMFGTLTANLSKKYHSSQKYNLPKIWVHRAACRFCKTHRLQKSFIFLICCDYTALSNFPMPHSWEHWKGKVMTVKEKYAWQSIKKQGMG